MDWVVIPGERFFMLKASFTADGYQVTVTDLTTVWKQCLAGQALKREGKVQGSEYVYKGVSDENLEQQLLYMKKALMNENLAGGGDNDVFPRIEMTLEADSRMELKLLTRSEGIEWTFKLSKEDIPGSEVSREIIAELLSILASVHTQRKEMIKLLAEKDFHLQAYEKGEPSNRHPLAKRKFHADSIRPVSGPPKAVIARTLGTVRDIDIDMHEDAIVATTTQATGSSPQATQLIHSSPSSKNNDSLTPTNSQSQMTQMDPPSSPLGPPQKKRRRGW